MEKITVKISAAGEIEFDVQGVRGKSCKDLTRAIEDLGQVVESKNTAEYCQVPLQDEKHTKQR